MSLQLGFDGAVKLLEGSDASIDCLLGLTADKYQGFTEAIDVGESDRAVYWRIAFAILSVHSPIDGTFAAYRSVRLWRARFGRLPSQRKLADLLLQAKGEDGIVNYRWQKADYLREFDSGWSADKSQYTRNGDNDIAWRERLQRNVKGLGLAKASFAVALASPATADICCIDTHIFAVFNGGKAPGKAIARRVYLDLEERIRTFAHKYGISVFAAQWAIWDARRGQVNAHVALATI